ncbi:MAG: hypothetical protein EOQ41_24555 [Mesorhizobium sp.]|uniref:hypothetical protein n=1 Tax=Mesorhizobium sp. TaxID=1871066 RepID=UPI000FE9B3A4|nr:hypothetical protein [Mesorhizobium sp.]RWB25120.1 MAG: hypothetical protein EOQ41_24555 [Mesorhizobium sp.]
MLEALDQTTLRIRLGIEVDEAGLPSVGSVAAIARACIQAWRTAGRARVTAYLNRQLLAAGFKEEQLRERVSEVIDALIDIGDVIAVRLDGKPSLVSSRQTLVRIAETAYTVLGEGGDNPTIQQDPRRYARGAAAGAEHPTALGFSDWLGPAQFRLYLARRLGGSADGTINEFWATLQSTLRHQASPLDLARLRAVVAPPSAEAAFFGRHNLPAVTGRWTSDVPNGTWCGVRPGRNPNEWHPILAHVEGSAAQALDLYDWDEWAWALLARGLALGAPERSNFLNGVLAFEHPVPRQFTRALRLLGGPGSKAWTWRISEAANRCFDAWRNAEI